MTVVKLEIAQARNSLHEAFRATSRLSTPERYGRLLDVRDTMLGLSVTGRTCAMIAARAEEVSRVIDLVVEWRILDKSTPRSSDKSAEERRLLDLIGEMTRIANGLSPDFASAQADLMARKLAA